MTCPCCAGTGAIEASSDAPPRPVMEVPESAVSVMKEEALRFNACTFRATEDYLQAR